MNIYLKSGEFGYAHKLFDEMSERNVVSWNMLISGYAKTGRGMSMRKGCLVRREVFLSNSLVGMYSKCGRVDIARVVFEKCGEFDEVSWNSMIAGYGKGGLYDEMLRVLVKMHRCGVGFSSYVLGSVLNACFRSFGDSLIRGKLLHSCSVKLGWDLDVVVGTALLDMYAKVRDINDAISVFGLLLIWTSAIVGHAQNGEYERALVIFCELLKNELKPDEFTVSTVLSACANLGGVRCGEQIQNYSVKSGIVKSSVVVNSLVYMYAKSGDIDSANQAFDLADKSDVVSWSVMICSTAHHGCAKEALTLFDLMISMGIAPNDVAFLGVLTACSHGGLVEEGLRYYETMKRDYNITPTEKHCACIVDLFGLAGRLSDAKSFITNSSFSDAPVMWRSLLSSCRTHKNMEIGKQVAERLTELDPQSSSSYVLLYNIYNDAKMEPRATKIRDLMTNQRIKKEPGLNDLLHKIKKFGYVDEKLTVNHHSEKLAVTLGLLSLPLSAPVRVMKNLRKWIPFIKNMRMISGAAAGKNIRLCCQTLRSYVATELPTKDSSLQFDMMALIFLEESDYSGVLLDLLSDMDNVAALLLEKFVSILLGRSKGRSLNLNLEVVAEAFMSVEDPLVIVCSGYLRRIHGVDTSSHSVNVGTTLEPPSLVNSNLNANPVNICKAEGKMKENSLKEMSESTNGEKGDLQSTFPSESTTEAYMILVEGEHSKLNALSDTVDQSQQGKQMVASECSSSSKTKVEQTSDHALVGVELESQSGDGNTLTAKNKKGNRNKGKKGKLIKACGRLDYARKMSKKDFNSWAIMKNWIMVCVLKACGETMNVELGEQVHGWLMKSGNGGDLFVGSSLISFYGKVGCFEDGDMVFDTNESRRNRACWNAMLTSLVQNGCLVEAIKFLYQMRAAGVQPQELCLNKLRSLCGSEVIEIK
ncbi:pentatricopeptide repeat-containing protein [Tanacetum coccineum]